LDQLELERSAMASIARSIIEKDIYNFFTDEGLLPNYAFPEAGILLRSVIWQRQGSNVPPDHWTDGARKSVPGWQGNWPLLRHCDLMSLRCILVPGPMTIKHGIQSAARIQVCPNEFPS
jgi:hypothetical protein